MDWMHILSGIGSAVGGYLIIDLLLVEGPVWRMMHALAARMERGGGASSKKQLLREKEVELQLKQAELEQERIRLREKEVELRNKRLELLGKALDADAPTNIIAAIDSVESDDQSDLGPSDPAKERS